MRIGIPFTANRAIKALLLMTRLRESEADKQKAPRAGERRSLRGRPDPSGRVLAPKKGRP